MRYAAALLCCWLRLLGAVASGADLVKDGKPVGEFVLSADAPQAEVFATTDVRHWIQEITGAKVPVLSRPSTGDNTKVFVGKVFAADFKDDLKELASTDGFAIRRKNNNVYVFGDRPRGTMYGVFALLEKNSDIIWARPNIRFGTVFGKTADLILTDTECLEIPAFGQRWMDGGHPPHAPTTEWQMRNRDNNVGRLNDPAIDLVNTLGTNLAVPIARLFKDHPEYFAWYPATRERRGVSSGEGSMCIMHPGLPEIWAREVLRMIAEREARDKAKVDVFTIGPGDNWYCCCCPECTKPLHLPDGSVLEMKDPDAQKDPLFRSTQIFMFLNEATKTLEKERPDVQFAMLAYIHAAEPPKVRPHPRLAIWFAPYDTCNQHFSILDPRQSPLWRERFEKWLTLTDTLGFYEYWICKPGPLGYPVAENLRALLKASNHRNAPLYAEFNSDWDNGNTSRYGPSASGWDIGGMNNWVIHRLLWDPNQDVDGLYRYYIQRAYREAAPQMTEYYELIKKNWLDPADTSFFGPETGYSCCYQNLIIARKQERRVFNILSQAAAAALTPNSKALIERMLVRFKGMSAALVRLQAASLPQLTAGGSIFDSPAWGQAQSLADFKISTRLGNVKPPSQETTIKAAHDGKNLYVRFSAADNDPASLKTITGDGKTELWPRGDHIELWLSTANASFVFAFDAAGNKYDAKNYDRSWNSGWTLRTRRSDNGYEAVAAIALASLGLVPGQESKVTWFCVREINHGRPEPEEVSYQGHPLGSVSYPLVLE